MSPIRALDQTYYLPRTRRVIGPRAEELGAWLYAVWMREPFCEARHYDGTSTWIDERTGVPMLAIVRGAQVVVEQAARPAPIEVASDACAPSLPRASSWR